MGVPVYMSSHQSEHVCARSQQTITQALSTLLFVVVVVVVSCFLLAWALAVGAGSWGGV